MVRWGRTTVIVLRAVGLVSLLAMIVIATAIVATVVSRTVCITHCDGAVVRLAISSPVEW